MEQATASLNPGTPGLAQRIGAAAFWRWWTGTLAGLIPASLTTAFEHRNALPVVEARGDELIVSVPRVGSGRLDWRELARIPASADEASGSQAGRAAIAQLRAAGFPRAASGVKVAVALPRDQVLRKQLTLPGVVEPNLRQAMGWDLDRHSPFPPEQLYYDAVVVGREPATGQIRVDLAMALRTQVDAALRRVEGWGAAPVAVVPARAADATAAADPSKFNLLPEDRVREVPYWRKWHFWLPVALLVLVGGTAILLPLWQKRDQAIALSSVAEEARVKAAAADALRTELERATGDYNFVLGKKFAFPPTVQLLEDVTKLLPDDTWLLQFELKSTGRGKETLREMLLRGESGSAGRLVALLENSNLVQQASPRSPMTKIQPGPGEIFDLGAQLKPLPPPVAEELVAAVGKAGGAAAQGPAVAGAASTAATAVPAAPARPPAPASAATTAATTAAAPASSPAQPPAAAPAVPAPAVRPAPPLSPPPAPAVPPGAPAEAAPGPVPGGALVPPPGAAPGKDGHGGGYAPRPAPVDPKGGAR
jgi:general secretion pathway protein L